MAACGGFEHILPWKSIKTVHHHSFTEIFGQLYSKENEHDLDSLRSPTSSSPSSTISTNSSFPNDESRRSCIDQDKKQHKRDDSVSSMNSESCISTCTEVELGFESSDEDLVKNEEFTNESQQHEQERRMTHCQDYGFKSKIWSRRNIKAFPPPISSIGRNGRPWVCFKSYRKDGRFILKEIRIPTQEFLHACRQNGRLKMQFIQSDDEFHPQDHEQHDDENNEGDAEPVRA